MHRIGQDQNTCIGKALPPSSSSVPEKMPKGRQKAAHKRGQQRQQRKLQSPRTAKKQHSKWTSSSNAAKIQEYMTSHGVIRKPIIGDGNCLFRAMADQLGYGENRHREIREKVVETIRADKAYFENFIDGEEIEGVDAYCDEMIQDGKYDLLSLADGVDF